MKLQKSTNNNIVSEEEQVSFHFFPSEEINFASTEKICQIHACKKNRAVFSTH